MDNTNYEFKVATSQDVQTIKDIINEMYRSEYEKRDNSKIAKAIEDELEIYILAYKDNKCIGFSGASLNNDYYSDIITPDIAVIDYIYVLKNSRDIYISFQLISLLLKKLISIGVKQAIIQVQTYNKQRFFHYALSDKNIIKSKKIEISGKQYEDQILFIEDLTKVANFTARELMEKAHKYFTEDIN